MEQLLNRKTIYYFGIFLVAIFFTQCSGQKAPPGTQLLKDADTQLYLDNAPITNFAWTEYLHWIKENQGINSERFINALPDSALWTDANGKPFEGIKSLGPHSDARYYPIVGITYEQAKQYCRWRSKVVNIRLQKVANIGDKKVEYALPSEEHYEKALPYRTGEHRGGFYPVDTDAEEFRHLCDNVHEMLAEENFAVSAHIGDTCISVISYDQPAKDLGFRCIAVYR